MLPISSSSHDPDGEIKSIGSILVEVHDGTEKKKAPTLTVKGTWSVVFAAQPVRRR